MKKFSPKQRWQNVVFSKAMIFVLALVTIFAANAAWNMYQKYREAHLYSTRAQAQLNDLEARKEMLEKNISELKTPRGVEKELREHFGVVKEGEEVVIILDEPAHEEYTRQLDTQKSFLKKILDMFKN